MNFIQPDPDELARLRPAIDLTVLAPIFETIERVRAELPRDVAPPSRPA